MTCASPRSSRTARAAAVILAAVLVACGSDPPPAARCPAVAPVEVVEAPLFRGALFDAVVAEPAGRVGDLACRMEDEGVEKAGLAVPLEPRRAQQDEVAFRGRVGEDEPSFVPFAALAGGDVGPGEVERLLRNST